MTERQVALPLKKAEQLLEALDQLEEVLRGGACECEPSLTALQQAEQLEALRQDLELAILRCPR